MKLDQLKELAARTLRVGKHKIKVPDQERAAEAITRDDVRELIKEKAIVVRKKVGVSRARAKKKKGRKGPGKRRGSKKAREKGKRAWTSKVRAQRKKLKEKRPERYRKLYRMVKSGYFKSVKHLEAYIRSERGKKWS